MKKIMHAIKRKDYQEECAFTDSLKPPDWQMEPAVDSASFALAFALARTLDPPLPHAWMARSLFCARRA